MAKHEENTMIQEKNTRVSILYTVKLESGEIVKGDPAGEGLEHISFVTGYRQALPGLEDRLVGHQEGEKMEFTVPPEEAFGPYDQRLIVEKSFDEFPEARDFIPGKWVLAQNPAHRITCGYFIREKKENSVLLDYNHPLAGKALCYTLTITEARPASGEELKVLKPCQYDPDVQPIDEE
jgi:FKBP-type peptidyl-prolyl cis-trans isomerase SlyD